MGFYKQGKNYGYEKTTEEGIAKLTFNVEGSVEEISEDEYSSGLLLQRRLREEEEEKIKSKNNEQNKEDYEALINAGIPANTAKRLTGYYE